MIYLFDNVIISIRCYFREILGKNGSVVDAAISTLLANSLVNAQSMSIGGGFFMLHYSKKDEKITVIDARETAPELSSNDMFLNSSHSKIMGGRTIATPGEIKGFYTTLRYLVFIHDSIIFTFSNYKRLCTSS